jgi:hypothetical protein
MARAKVKTNAVAAKIGDAGLGMGDSPDLIPVHLRQTLIHRFAAGKAGFR